MISYSPLLCLDFYKTAHAEQYPATLTKMVSYYTPRMTRLADTEKVTMFGLQAFIQEYLIEAFNTHFFDRSLDEVLAEYKRVLNNTIGTDGVGVERLTALHKEYQSQLCVVGQLYRNNAVMYHVAYSDFSGSWISLPADRQ